MPETTLLKPDLKFKREVLGLGAHDLTACYQCGTCSIVCPISTEGNPFPRKEMIWVQWGLKDKALANSSTWLCHQCGTCSAYCPRDAKPSDVMAALRDYSITHYAVPQFMGRALNEPKYLPLLFAIPAIILLLVLGWLGNLTSLPEGRIVYSKFFPINYIEIIFVATTALSGIGAVVGGIRYWKAICGQMGGTGKSPVKFVVPTLLTIFKHIKLKECEEAPVGTRETHKSHLHKTHLAVFWGVMGLVVTTASVGVGIIVFGYLTPWPLLHPVKILGNVSGAALIAGLAVFMYRRIADKENAGKNTYSDWLFLDILLLTAITGFLCEILRLADMPGLAYPTYFIHLVFVFFLLVYIPYSKFAHIVYRFVAMLHAEASGQAGRSGPSPRPVESMNRQPG